MMKTLKFLLRKQLTRSRVVQQVGGFTLIELLVAMIMAFLVITPLMGFMINIMNTDRQEQAKANSEQEIQAALDYIARDLQQAIYIYDATGIGCLTGTADTNTPSTCPNANTTGNQLPSPTATDRVPVLVFWKRELVSQAITVGSQKDDTFVYSLVVYYLIKDNNATWSKAARITRWQIKDGVPDAGGQVCNGYTGKYVTDSDDKYCPSPGFAPFKLDGIGSITEKMNAWTKEPTATDSPSPIVLVDFIDQTKTDEVSTEQAAKLAATCPPNSTSPPITWSKVAPNTTTFNTRDTFKMTGFYACVDRANTTAQVIIRGNALARIENDQNQLKNTDDSKKTYFPTASVRVQGRGYLYTK
jgi:type II secretory pathway pseudopilin PulG